MARVLSRKGVDDTVTMLNETARYSWRITDRNGKSEIMSTGLMRISTVSLRKPYRR